MHKYEAMFILNPALSEDERKAVCNEITDAIVKNKGTVTQSSIWSEKKRMCFRIKKCDDGVYLLVNFTLPPQAVSELKNTYRINENILRVLITRREKS